MTYEQKPQSFPKWTIQEDQLLKDLREIRQFKSWKNIAFELNSHFYKKERSGKQCRQRYMNYVKFGEDIYKNQEWSAQQDQLLLKMFMVYGPKWVKISKETPGRSENSLKNRFNNALGRAIRRIRKVECKKKIKTKKPISNRALIKILERLGQLHCVSNQNTRQVKASNSELDFFAGLAAKLAKFITCDAETISEDETYQIILSIHKFNSILKSIWQQRIELKSPNQFEQSLNPNLRMLSQEVACNESEKQQKSLENQFYRLNESERAESEERSFDERLSLVCDEDEEKYRIFNKDIDLQEQVCNILDIDYVPRTFVYEE